MPIFTIPFKSAMPKPTTEIDPLPSVTQNFSVFFPRTAGWLLTVIWREQNTGKGFPSPNGCIELMTSASFMLMLESGISQSIVSVGINFLTSNVS